MNPKKIPLPAPTKAPTGIAGFDEITRGGLPRGCTTLLEGGPGSGKTIMALQTLVNGARDGHEPGIFVAFEESSERVMTNAAKFGWNLAALQKKNLFFLDAQPSVNLFQSGDFDLSGMLAALDAKVREMKARRIVLDSLDVVLMLLPDPVAQQREVYRLHDWLLTRGLTAIITRKSGRSNADEPQFNFMQFMVDCAVILNQTVDQGISHRNLRVIKYRGTGFAENETPFLIAEDGVEVSGVRDTERSTLPVTNERVSTGIAPLDVMIGGGYFRGASILITGTPGTAKSTLSGAFAEAACKRGERTLFVSFDSDANEVVRNLSSVNIRLARFIKQGLLHLVSARAITGNAEIHLMRIKRLALEHRARCAVIDPVSSLAKAGNQAAAHSVAERLIDWAKSTGITLVSTSLLDKTGGSIENTFLEISTIADTWIHLNYQVHAGERNRGLTIVKSRGTAHSNQVRELILSKTGVTLADAFTAGGEVLMGTLRWEKEREVLAAQKVSVAAAKQKQAAIASEAAVIEGKLKDLQHALSAKRAEQDLLTNMHSALKVERTHNKDQMRALRGMDKL